MAGAELIQIYYADYQLKHLFPFAIPYFNEKLTVYFENEPISQLVMSSTAKNIAVCSWKLKDKLRWNVPGPTRTREITQELIDGDYEVLSFTRNSPHHNMLAAAEVWHQGFIKVFSEMLERIGAKLPLGKIKYPINQNHFSARRNIYQDYVTKYLRPAMKALKQMPEAMRDAGYSKLMPDAPVEHLQKQIGLSWYPLCPFLLERLFSVYCQNSGIKVEYL